MDRKWKTDPGSRRMGSPATTEMGEDQGDGTTKRRQTCDDDGEKEEGTTSKDGDSILLVVFEYSNTSMYVSPYNYYS